MSTRRSSASRTTSSPGRRRRRSDAGVRRLRLVRGRAAAAWWHVLRRDEHRPDENEQLLRFRLSAAARILRRRATVADPHQIPRHLPLDRWGVRVSATYQNNPGPNITASYAVAVAQVTPSLGRPLSGGARTATVPLVAAGVAVRRTDASGRFARGQRPTGAAAPLRPQVDFYNLLNANHVLTLNNDIRAGVAASRCRSCRAESSKSVCRPTFSGAIRRFHQRHV